MRDDKERLFDANRVLREIKRLELRMVRMEKMEDAAL